MVANNSTSNFGQQSNLNEENISLKDYLILFRMNFSLICVITLAISLGAFLYAINLPDIYKSTTMLKLSKPKSNILEEPLIPELSDSKATFVENEIEILKSYTVREKVSQLLLDSVNSRNLNSFSVVFKIKDFNDRELLPLDKLAEKLLKCVSIEQKKNLELIYISVESPSPREAALIANLYAKVYRNINLEFNREQMINIREFLENQSTEKKNELLTAENTLKGYQEQRGIIQLDEQSRALIDQLSTFEANRNSAKIELTIAEKNLNDYKSELQKREPGITQYMEKIAIEPYLEALQKEIASLEVRKDLALKNNQVENRKGLLADYEIRIADLKEKRDNKLKVFRTGMLALSSDEIKSLIQRVLEAEIKYHSALASYMELGVIVDKYEREFNELPKRTIDYARLEREKGEAEKLYLLIQEKYQEAMINEQATPGNVIIIDKARVSELPSKPNRKLIILVGLLFGLGTGIMVVYIKNYFDNSIKTPDDIQKLNINLIGWVPKIDGADIDGVSRQELVVIDKPTSTPSEAYRAMRTRIQFAQVDRDSIKTILLTSGSPGEGKTVSSANLAASFAQTGKRTILVDCDLRKPRCNKLFEMERIPGFTDYFIGTVTYDEIIKDTGVPDLYFIPAGEIPVNPAELLSSKKMQEFLSRLEKEYDLIILDSPPLLAVTDAEILSRLVDVTLLVTRAGQTEIDVLKKSVELLMHDHSSFSGVILNDFIYKNGYGTYYKSYYYYAGHSSQKRMDKIKDFLSL